MATAPGFVVEMSQAAGYFGSRWRGEVNLSKLYWRDMMIVGSVINMGPLRK